jgi:hypothetical protein
VSGDLGLADEAAPRWIGALDGKTAKDREDTENVPP